MSIKRINPLSKIYSIQKRNSKDKNEKKDEKEIKSNCSKTFEEILNETQKKKMKRDNETER